MLDVSSTSKGFLPPRMLQSERDLISLPATGLMLYQTDGVPGLYCNTGTPAVPVWQLIGPAPALAYANFTGTSGQAVANGSYYNMPFPNIIAASGITFNSGTNIATVTNAGLYRISFYVTAGVAVNQFGVFLSLNGSNVNNSGVFHFSTSNVTAVLSHEYLLNLAANDNIAIRMGNVTGSGSQTIYGRSFIITQIK